MSKKVLGKGLEALIPQTFTEETARDQMLQIPIENISVNPHQPRKRFDEAKIKSLSESIRHDGILQPIVVRSNGDRYELIMGERRLQAARLAGVPSVPAVVRPAADVDSLRLALVENLQRENLSAIEVAEAYHSLIERFGLSQAELADLVGKDRSSVANTMRLLALPAEVRDMIQEGQLSEGHARALLSLDTGAEQIALAKRIVKERLSVRQVENIAGARTNKGPKTSKAKEKPAHITFLENAISSYLSTRVNLEEKRNGKGRLTIEFYSHEEFERLAELMNIPLPR